MVVDVLVAKAPAVPRRRGANWAENRCFHSRSSWCMWTSMCSCQGQLVLFVAQRLVRQWINNVRQFLVALGRAHGFLREDGTSDPDVDFVLPCVSRFGEVCTVDRCFSYPVFRRPRILMSILSRSMASRGLEKCAQSILQSRSSLWKCVLAGLRCVLSDCRDS